MEVWVGTVGMSAHLNKQCSLQNTFGLGALWSHDVKVEIMENAFIYALNTFFLTKECLMYMLGIAECKRAQPSGTGGSLSGQLMIELLGSIKLLEGPDGSINSFPNFVRMHERSFTAVEKLSKWCVSWSSLIPRLLFLFLFKANLGVSCHQKR